MISYLLGKPIPEKENITLLTNGVGYGVFVSDKTKNALQNKNEVELYIYTHVKEEALDLYGFQTRDERELFLLLLSVSGIGPKTALHILNIEVNDIIFAVQNADVTLFSQVPRVGKKVAQKIIIELKNKLGSLKELDLGPISEKRQEVILALQSLGFDERSIAKSLESLQVEELTVSEAVKLAMKKI